MFVVEIHTKGGALKLSEVSRSRDNNFNLIRMLAAMAVLFSHSYALSIGTVDAEPMYLWLGLTWGDVAVDIFFVTSGFLVTASLLVRRNTIEFVWARGLRIYPGLWAMLVLVTFGLGVYLTSEPLGAYLISRTTWKYLLKNSVLFDGIEYFLPGVFAGNPGKSAVNGSLWTLPIELAMYGTLLSIWVAARLGGAHRLVIFKSVVLGIVLVAGCSYLFNGTYFANIWPRLYFMFYSGASFYVLRNYVRLSSAVFWALAVMTVLSSFNRTVFFFAFNAGIVYLTFYAAYAVGGGIRRYNRLGDYSYGVYIYAFPTQQTVVALLPGVPPLSLFVLSAPATLVLSVLSWHLVERHALVLKERCASSTSRWLDLLRSR